jgi:hypothetical protein
MTARGQLNNAGGCPTQMHPWGVLLRRAVLTLPDALRNYYKNPRWQLLEGDQHGAFAGWPPEFTNDGSVPKRHRRQTRIRRPIVLELELPSWLHQRRIEDGRLFNNGAEQLHWHSGPRPAPSPSHTGTALGKASGIKHACVIGSIAAAPWVPSTGNGRLIESSMPPGFRFTLSTNPLSAAAPSASDWSRRLHSPAASSTAGISPAPTPRLQRLRA